MDHFVVLFGSLLAAAAVIAVILRFARQSSIIAFILVGVVAGLFREQIHLPHELLDVFTELGIILLLFMAGLEVDFRSLRKNWRLVLGNGLGQIFCYTAIGSLLGYLLLGLREGTSIVYFGLCLTFSSTIVVLGFLKTTRQMESLHGQIILGLMVIQDIVAVLALAILGTLVTGSGIGVSLLLVFLKLFGLCGLLAIMVRLFLHRLFRKLAEAQDLLFIGSLGFVMGIAALCESVHFSPEIGAFMAGASLSFLPYRLEIQDKVEPMKDFGVILFFIALGYGLNIMDASTQQLGAAAAIGSFVVITTPIIMLLLGYLQELKSRPSFTIGFVINQISEFSLILATLCVGAGVFDKDTFLVVALAAVGTILLSGLGHQVIDRMYLSLRRPLHFIDAHSRARREAQLEGFELEDHIVLIGYNELAERLLEHYEGTGRNVLLIDIDPNVFDVMSGKSETMRCMYADAMDPDTWEEASLPTAAGVVSCMIGGQQAELSILRWLRDKGLRTPLVAATDSRADALELYREGATYVVETEDLAAESFGRILQEHGQSLDGLIARGKAHQERLHDAKGRATFRFM